MQTNLRILLHSCIRLIYRTCINSLPLEWRRNLHCPIAGTHDGFGGELLGLRDLITRAALITYYSPDCSSSEREHIKAAVMTDPATSIEWATHYLREPVPQSVPECQSSPRYRMAVDAIDSQHEVLHVHQVAASSGREIAALANMFPDRRFSGSDINDELVAWQNQTWSKPANLHFVRWDLNSPTSSVCSLSPDLIVAYGGLQYLDQNTLRNFFGLLSRCGCQLVSVQPVQQGFDIHGDESAPRGSWSWSHPYVRLAKAQGLKVKEWYTYSNCNAPWASTICLWVKP